MYIFYFHSVWRDETRGYTRLRGVCGGRNALTGGQVINDALQLVLFQAYAQHHQLLEEQQDVAPDDQYVLLSGSGSV